MCVCVYTGSPCGSVAHFDARRGDDGEDPGALPVTYLCFVGPVSHLAASLSLIIFFYCDKTNWFAALHLVVIAVMTVSCRTGSDVAVSCRQH